MNHTTPSRHGGGFVKFVVGVVVIAALVVLGWGVFANWHRDADRNGQADGFTLRVGDPEWWDASKQDAQPLVAKARDWALEQKEEIWGEGGYLDQGETWLEDWQAQKAAGQDVARPEGENGSGKLQTGRGGEAPADPATGDPTTTAPAQPTAAPAPAGPTKSPATLRQEERIQAAEESFAKGLEEYRSANPEGGWTDERVAHYDAARDHFRNVRRILVEEDTIATYESYPDHDPLIAKKAGELAQLNQKLLYDATKAGGGM